MSNNPQFLLPFAEKEYVDIQRACKILGLRWVAVVRLAHSGLIDMIDYREGAKKKVRYHSIVDFCDRLRKQYNIPDRRPQLSAPYLRHKDDDLLPFPLKDTIGAPEALAAMGLHERSRDTLLKLIRDCEFEAYQINHYSAWRISRPSFIQYMERVHAGPRDRRYAYAPRCEISILREV